LPPHWLIDDKCLHDGLAGLLQRRTLENVQQADDTPCLFCHHRVVVGRLEHPLDTPCQLSAPDFVSELPQKLSGSSNVGRLEVAHTHLAAGRDGRRSCARRPHTLPIWRTASSTRLASASQNALNSG